MEMVRQGDVLVIKTEKLLEGERMNRHMGHAVLAHGEATGHFHGLLTPNAVHFRPDDAPAGCFSLHVTEDEAVLYHTDGTKKAEHDEVTVKKGSHVVLVPYEYDELGEAKRVVD